jgi:uncharacterized YigZ family protein
MVDKINEIKTIKNPAEFKIKEKGSIFYGKSFFVENEESSNQILVSIKKKYFDATHHCFAFRLSTNAFQYSDDGEPSGTAGIRILNAIDHYKLSYCLIVVVRYFGGTKLGIGHLGKAYYNAALKTLEYSGIINRKLYSEVILTCNFSKINLAYRILNTIEAKILNTSYGEEIKIFTLIEQLKIGQLKSAIAELSQDQIKVFVTNNTNFI